MTDTPSSSMKHVLSQWVTERQTALLEQVMLTWHEAMGRMNPDDDLVELLLATQPLPEVVELPAEDLDGDLGAALDLLEAATTQGEVLKRLLDNLQPLTGRCALFVVKQGIASLYGHRGFDPGTARTGAPVVPPAQLEDLIQGRTGLILGPGPAYEALLGPLGQAPAPNLRILPLHLRRKTVAIVLVDSGPAGALRRPNHMRALALGAEARLSHLAGIKEEERAAPPEPHPSMLTQRIPDPIAEVAGPALDPKVRANAERSARVLVGDIELYFPEKVQHGQDQGNLYGALRDELDRSRHSFVERYGVDLEAQHQIFYQTVVQQLCGGNAARLGQPPWAAH
jgi:hypothetical protein